MKNKKTLAVVFSCLAAVIVIVSVVIVIVVLGANKHDTEYREANAATCTEDGNIEYYECKECGKYFADKAATVEISADSVIIKATGHATVSHAAKPATCTEKGYNAYETCSRCDYTTYHETPALGHATTNHTAKPATCTEKGYDAYVTCSRCDYTTYHETPALGHATVNHTAKTATCTEKGYNAYETCSRCDYTTYHETPALGHATVNHTAKPATCTEKGYDAYVTCSRCDYTTYDETFPALGHDWNGYICNRCGAEHEGTQGLEFMLNSDNVSYSVSGIGTVTDKDILIPRTYNNLPVTSIENSAFRGCSSLTSITISDSVTSIGNSAFENCIKLTSIIIPNSVTSIGGWAFSGCSNLTSITIPDSVTSIRDYAFSNCSRLTSITIPDSVTSIRDYAFSNCSRLTSITIPDSVTSICKSAFSGCSSLKYNEYDNGYYLGNANNLYVALIKVREESITSCTINSNTKVIASFAFRDCSSLTSITIPDSVTSICESAFSGCSSLKYNEYDNGYYLGNANNLYVALIKVREESITSCTINSNTKVIASFAFSNCDRLTSITIPDSVTSIGNYAFSSCINLTSITVGNSVTSIENSAFNNCINLTSITVASGNTVYHSAGNCLIETATKTLIAGCKNSVIPTDGSVISIGNYAFENCGSLTSITIPDSITSIENSAFNNCINLTSITVASGNTVYHSAGNCLIETATKTLIAGCKNSVIPTDGSVISIGNSAFSGCDSLTSITIPDSVTSIGNYAFRDCSSLKSITIPNSVTSIGSYAFYGCRSLTSITIPNSVTSIGYHTFYGCRSFTSITLPFVGMSKYGNSNYFGYIFGADSYIENSKYVPSSLKTVIITGGTSIGHRAFWGCSSLTSLTLPDSVTSIGNYAFNYCSGLTSITIPNSVTSIGDHAFDGCSKLTSITIPNSVRSIGSYVFSGLSIDITFTGTKAQWNAVAKNSDWYFGNYTIHCTDGDIQKQ